MKIHDQNTAEAITRWITLYCPGIAWLETES